MILVRSEMNDNLNMWINKHDKFNSFHYELGRTKDRGNKTNGKWWNNQYINKKFSFTILNTRLAPPLKKKVLTRWQIISAGFDFTKLGTSQKSSLGLLLTSSEVPSFVRSNPIEIIRNLDGTFFFRGGVNRWFMMVN